MRWLLVLLLLLVPTTPAPASEPHRTVEEARSRMEYHLREFNQLSEHFESLMQKDCPQFSSPGEWTAYLDTEVERVVTLVAHLEQAWIEAKSTGDDEVRRAAKAPRKRVDQARALLDKLQGCAQSNGAEISQGALWRRIEREVPRRQVEIALPQ